MDFKWKFKIIYAWAKKTKQNTVQLSFFQSDMDHDIFKLREGPKLRVCQNNFLNTQML